METAGWACAGEEAGLFLCGGVSGKVSRVSWSVPLAPEGPTTPAPPQPLLPLSIPPPPAATSLRKSMALPYQRPHPSSSGLEGGGGCHSYHPRPARTQQEKEWMLSAIQVSVAGMAASHSLHPKQLQENGWDFRSSGRRCPGRQSSTS